MKRTAIRRRASSATRGQRDALVDAVPLVFMRAAGRCELCASELRGKGEFQHRLARKMGGRRSDDTSLQGASNLLLLGGQWSECRCHPRVEKRGPFAAAFAVLCRLLPDPGQGGGLPDVYDCGWALREGQDPLTTPVLYRGRWVLLDDDGGVQDAQPPA